MPSKRRSNEVCSNRPDSVLWFSQAGWKHASRVARHPRKRTPKSDITSSELHLYKRLKICPNEPWWATYQIGRNAQGTEPEQHFWYMLPQQLRKHEPHTPFVTIIMKIPSQKDTRWSLFMIYISMHGITSRVPFQACSIKTAAEACLPDFFFGSPNEDSLLRIQIFVKSSRIRFLQNKNSHILNWKAVATTKGQNWEVMQGPQA